MTFNVISVRVNQQKQQPMLFSKIFKKAIEKKINLIGIFFDLSKAYEAPDHKILLFKLDAYGISSLMNQWFKSYLCNRKQYVEINNMENTSQISEKFTSTLKKRKVESLRARFSAQFCFCYI